MRLRSVGRVVGRLAACIAAVAGVAWASHGLDACVAAEDEDAPWLDRARSLIAVLEPDLALPSAVFASDDFDALRIVLGGRGDDPRDDETLARRAILELAAAYGVPSFRSTHADASPHALVADETWLGRAAHRVRAVGIAVRTSLPDGDIVAVGAYWSTPIMERLRVVRIDPSSVEVHGRDLDAARSAYLSTLSTCAVDVDEWIELSEATARTFVRNDAESWMFSFGPAYAASSMWSQWIPGPRIESALAFEDRGLRAETSYSALFAGRTPGLMSVLASLTTVRSSMTVQELATFVRDLF